MSHAALFASLLEASSQALVVESHMIGVLVLERNNPCGKAGLKRSGIKLSRYAIEGIMRRNPRRRLESVQLGAGPELDRQPPLCTAQDSRDGNKEDVTESMIDVCCKQIGQRLKVSH